jgi:hypothetical protein
MPDGNYELDVPYEGVFIEIIKGKVKQIIHALKQEPTPNPLETPPMQAEGAIGIVGGEGLMSKEKIENMNQKFDDNKISTVDGATQGDNNNNATTEGDGTVQTDKSQVYSIEQLSSMIDDAMGQIKTLSDRVTALEGGNDTTAQANNTAAPDNTAAPVDNTQKMSKETFNKEVNDVVEKKMKEFYDKNSPAKTLNFLEPEGDEIIAPKTQTDLRVKELEILRKRNKN